MSNIRSYTWNPDEMTLIRMNSQDKYESFKAFRVSSNGFINKKYIRELVFCLFNNKCFNCKSGKGLSIDHRLSVKHCFDNNLIEHCNILPNLQLLCSSCNSKKGGKCGE